MLSLLPPLFGYWSSVLGMFNFNDVLLYLNFPPSPHPTPQQLQFLLLLWLVVLLLCVSESNKLIGLTGKVNL